MYATFLKSLNIERREAGMVYLLVFQSFFIGVFFATLENSATTLFMTQYGKDMLGNAYLASGLLGMVLTGTFSALQNKIKYSVLITGNLIFITLLTFAMWYSFSYTQWEWLVFVIFSLMGALYILSLVGFSGMAGRLFTLRQGKRLFSIIDSGLVFGMIVISLAIPFILRLIPELKDLILISAVSILFAFIFQVIITSRFDVNKRDDSTSTDDTYKSQKVGLKGFLSNKYIRLLSVFVMLSMITLFFTSYNFLTVGKINYPDQSDFAIFFANFTIAVMAFSFVIKTFIYSKLIKTYGLQVSLLVVPILIGIFAFIAGVVGTVFGYETDSASFVIFFLLLALVRFFAINLKDSIQTPSLRLLFQPIDPRIRYNIQAKVEGLVNEFSAVFSGLILAVIGAIYFIELINYSHILILIIAGWIYVTVQLYKEYQNMLRNSLLEYKRQKHEAELMQGAEKKEIKTPTENAFTLKKIERSLELMRDYEPTLFDIRLEQLLRESSIRAKELAIRSIDESEIYGAITELKKIAREDRDENIKKLANEVRIKLEKSYKDYLDEEKLIYLARSKNYLDRVKAAKIIGDSENHAYSSLIKNLLKDLVPQVKLQAIHSVVKLNNRDLWPVLIDQLSDANYKSAAENAIKGIGEPILESLEKAFYKSGAESELLTSIVGLYGKIGGEKAIKYLLKKLNDPNRKIVLESLYSLRKLNFRSENETITNQIYQAIEQNVGVAAWNLAAKYDVEEQEMETYLADALQRELEDNYDMIFLLLSLIYDPESIQHIRENIESGTTEGVSFAIEMLDLFIADQLKTVLFALLEDNRAEEKIRELELHYPINVYLTSDVLRQIMNRSANDLNNFTRACAIYNFLSLTEEDMVIGNDIIANLFNPDPLLQQTAAVVMNAIDPAVYNTVKDRLAISQQEKLEKDIAEFRKNKYSLLIEKAIYLSRVKMLQGEDSLLLEELCIHMTYGKCAAGSELLKKDKDNNYFFVISGGAEAQLANTKITFGSGELVNDFLFTDTDGPNSMVKATEEMEYFVITDQDYKSLLFRFPQLGEIMLRVFDFRISESGMAA